MLHWPSWATRWVAAHQRGQLHKPAHLIYDRLNRMRELGLVHRIVRLATTSIDQVRREHDLYCLAEQGTIVLARGTGQALEDIPWVTPRICSFLALTHSAAIGRFYAALYAKVETMQSIQLVG